AQIRDWARDTDDGSLSSRSYRPWSSVWDEVRSDSSNCMGRACPRRKECFYYAARERVGRAQILVVNHALFFSDLALRDVGAAILPEYDAVILDEAHTVEAVAGNHLGMSISSGQIDYTLRRLYNDVTNKGLFVHHEFKEGREAVLYCRLAADDLFADLHDLQSTLPNNGRLRETQDFENLLGPALRKLAKLTRNFGETMEPTSKQD
ncbi:MAG: helicase, partial [Pirellulaceae bacterium]